MLLPSAAAAQSHDPGKPLFDSRTREPGRAEAPEDPGAIRARDRLSAQLGRQGVLDVDARTGTPRMVAKLDGFLTGLSGDDPPRIALDYVRAQRGVFSLSDADLDGLRLVRRYRDDAGTTHLEWAQTWRGLAAFDNGLQAAVAADGRLINVSGSPLPGLEARSNEPGLSAGQALAKLLGGLAPRQVSQSGPDRYTRFTGGHDARLVLFGDRAGDVHLAWRVTANVASAELYDALVDAESGDLLFRNNKVDAAAGTVHAFSYHPGLGTQDPRPLEVVDDSRLFGPNAHVYADLNDSDTVNSGEEIPASSNSPPTWNFPSDSQQRSGSHLYYFVNEFHDWLKDPPFSFTAASGGFENDDRLIAETRDGAAIVDGPRNNAFMSTPKNGQSPRMSMFLWTYTTPPRDSSEDAGVVFHEYTHGLSNRLITDPAGEGALNSPQAEAMGEGWSDWYALDYLADPVNGSLDPDTTAVGELRVAEYLRPPNGIRAEPTDCPVGSAAAACAPLGAGGYTFGDFGRVASFTNEHTNGEIWAQTLWDLRTAITAPTARRVVTDGMRLAPDNPSMLEMRNAILQADQAAFGGANRAAIWQAFAIRGMGYFAVSYRGFDALPRENFDVPGPGATVTGRVTDALTGAPVPNALVTLASTASGFPGDVTAVSDVNGNYRIDGAVPGTYPRPLVDAAGYSPGFAPDVAVPSGGRTLDVQLVRNWASSAGGATATANGPNFKDFGCGPGGAIDSRYTTGWGSTSHNSPRFEQGTKSLTIALPEAIDVSAFNVDPGEVCGDESSAATGKFRIETSRDGVTFTEASAGAFTSANNHRPNVIDAPAGTKEVRFVKYTMLEPQSQGADHDGVDFMDTSEFEVYGVPQRVVQVPGTTTTAPLPPPDVPPVVQGTGIAAIDRAPPAARLGVTAGQSLRTVLAKGLKITVACNEPCSARLTARLDAKTAKRVGLLSRRSRAKATNVGAGTLRMGQVPRTATLRLTRKARTRLKRLREVKLAVAAVVTDRSGNSGNASRRVVIRR